MRYSDTNEATPRSLGYRFAAEWEPQRAVWLAWPHQASDFPGKLEAVRWAFCEMIEWLSRAGLVELMVHSQDQKTDAEQRLRVSGVNPGSVRYHVVPSNRSWTRDYLPSWLVPSTELGGEVAAVKWLFNGWARYEDHKLDESAGQWVAQLGGRRTWFPLTGEVSESAVEPSRFVLEGGAIDTDGQGTLITTTDCLLGSEFPRNPGMSREAIERVFSDYLSIDRVIWIPGDVAGDDTSGHVDDVARFVSPGLVVVPVEPNSSDPNCAPLAAARRILGEAKDARGRRLEVIELPMPAPRFYDGERLPATYANFQIANDVVLVPTFNDPQDRIALGIFSELFPERQVVGLHCADLVLGLGALHCSSNHEPAAQTGGGTRLDKILRSGGVEC